MDNNKPIIKEIVVVEGKSDTAKLQKLFNVQTIETNGLSINSKTISLIKLANKSRGVILFLDPDGPGEMIRQKIVNEVDGIKNCFINKKDVDKSKKKIGVAEANDEAIINAFNNVIKFNKNIQSISLYEYNSLNINSKHKRSIICNHYKISLCNNKQLFKRLNMMNITKSNLINLITKYENIWK